MRMLPLTDRRADWLAGGDPIAKASERALPADERRQAIAHVERILGHELTDAEAKRFAQVASIAPHMVPGDDPVELYPAPARGPINGGYQPRPIPVARLAQSGQVERTHVWSRWERIRWALRWANSRWLLLGLGLAAAIDLIVRALT